MEICGAQSRPHQRTQGNSFVLLYKQLRHEAFSKGIQSDLPRSLNVECCLYGFELFLFLLKFNRLIIMTQYR